MKKLTGEFRLRRMLVIGIAIGLVAGVLCTGVAAKSVLSKNKAEFAAEKEKLKKKTNELKEEIMKHEAANNSAEALGSDKEGWALVLVNLWWSWKANGLSMRVSKNLFGRCLTMGQKRDLVCMLLPLTVLLRSRRKCLMQPCRTGWQTDVRLWKLMMRRKSQWQFRERANMRPDLQWIL